MTILFKDEAHAQTMRWLFDPMGWCLCPDMYGVFRIWCDPYTTCGHEGDE